MTLYERGDDLMSGINFLDDIDARTFVVEIGTVSYFHVDRKVSVGDLHTSGDRGPTDDDHKPSDGDPGEGMRV